VHVHTHREHIPPLPLPLSLSLSLSLSLALSLSHTHTHSRAPPEHGDAATVTHVETYTKVSKETYRGKRDLLILPYAATVTHGDTHTHTHTHTHTQTCRALASASSVLDSAMCEHVMESCTSCLSRSLHNLQGRCVCMYVCMYVHTCYVLI
jgi:hypothetical protein